jgi:hypothetical protein
MVFGRASAAHRELPLAQGLFQTQGKRPLRPDNLNKFFVRRAEPSKHHILDHRILCNEVFMPGSHWFSVADSRLPADRYTRIVYAIVE